MNGKICLLLAAAAISAPSGAWAQEASATAVDDYFAQAVEAPKKTGEARRGAARLLDSKVKPVEIDVYKLPKEIRRALPPAGKGAAAQARSENLGPAPFGLQWGASRESIERAGARLAPIESEIDNFYSAANLPKPIADFPKIELVFGPGSELFRIFSSSEPKTDDGALNGAMFLYNKYYKLLDQKYGGAEQIYTPKITIIEKKIDLPNNKFKIETEEREEKIGNPGFREQIRSGEASLVAVFEGKGVGAALSLRVDEDGKSFIMIDYKGLNVLGRQDENILEAL